MTRVGVFLSAVLLATSLGVVAQDGTRKQDNPPPTSNAQVSQPLPSGSSVIKDPAQKATTGDRTKRIQGLGDGSEDLAQTGAPLPQTSTILPLLGFIGLGSLVAGLFARR